MFAELEADEIERINRKARQVCPMSVFVHESSYVDEGAVVGEGTKALLPHHGGSRRRNCNIGQNVVVSPESRPRTRSKSSKQRVGVYGVTQKTSVSRPVLCIYQRDQSEEFHREERGVPADAVKGDPPSAPCYHRAERPSGGTRWWAPEPS